jgi:hypothetical protein
MVEGVTAKTRSEKNEKSLLLLPAYLTLSGLKPRRFLIHRVHLTKVPCGTLARDGSLLKRSLHFRSQFQHALPYCLIPKPGFSGTRCLKILPA